MKIFYLANVRLPTEKAHGLQIMKTCEALANAGAEVVLCIPSGRNKTDADPFVYYDVKKVFTIRKVFALNLLGMRPAKLGFVLSQLSFGAGVSRVYMHEDDVVYSRDEYSLYPLSFYKKNIYFEAHDGRSNVFMRRIAGHATGIVGITKGCTDFYAERGVSPSRLAVAPDAVELGQFEAKNDPLSLRNSLKLPPKGPIITYSGSLGLYSWKGVDVLLESLKNVPIREAHFMIVGGNPREIEDLKKQYPDPRIIFVGRVAPHKVPDYLLASDILVLPNKSGDSMSEKFTSPMKLFEYMAAGKPIISSDLPSMREVLNGKNALFVTPNDPNALGAAIEKLVKDDGLARSLAIQAKNDSKNYSWEKRAEKILSFIQKTAVGHNSKQKDTAFYNKESENYTSKRYPAKSTDYVHAFFKKRLDIVEVFVGSILAQNKNPKLLEVGCADGIVLKRLKNKFSNLISSYKGIDISSGMIDVAKKLNPGIALEVRDPKECFGDEKQNIILEVGVLNYADFDKDIDCAAKALDGGGYFVCSIAGKSSLWDRMRKSETGFANFRTYNEYEKSFLNDFEIVSKKGVGVFIPGIWKVPALARVIQSIIENVISPIVPWLCHEKVYVLKRRV